MSSKVVFVIILLLAAGGGYYFYTHHQAEHVAGAQQQPDMMHMVMPVSVAEAIGRDVQQWHEFSGRLTAVDYVEIRSRVSGPIETINFKDGAIVQKGNLLFTIDPRPYAAEVARAQAALASAKAARDLSETQFKRAQSLIKDKAISQSDYDTRRNQFNEAAAQMQSAEASLETAKLNLDYTQIKSPITGRVSRPEITVGNLVEAGANSPLLTTVVSQNPIYADFDIDEDTYLKVAPETSGDVGKIEVALQLANGSKEHKGTVQSFDNRINPQSGTLRVRAVFNNDDGDLIPGLFARVRLGSAEKIKVVLVSDRAIGTDQSKKYVYVVGADNKVEYREVKLGDEVDGLRIITEGLKPGEKIIVDGLQRAHPGGEVKPEVVSMEASDSATGVDAGAPAPATGAAKDSSGVTQTPAQGSQNNAQPDTQGNDKK